MRTPSIVTKTRDNIKLFETVTKHDVLVSILDSSLTYEKKLQSSNRFSFHF
jgi:hypothetical protein